MRRETVANVLGALAQAIADEVGEAITVEAAGTANEAAALVHLAKYGGGSIEALRGPLGLSHPGCVRLVDRLQARRLVSRREAEDRRARSLELTRTGRSRARAVLASRQAPLHAALAVLSVREQQLLGTLVGRVLASLVDDESSALKICRVCDYGVCPDSVCPVAKALSG